jgi:hypothetical protein
MTLGSGATSTKSPGTTTMNIAQNNHSWSRSKTSSQNLIQNLIHKILKIDRSSTTPYKDEVVYGVSPLDVCDVVLNQPYMWKRHVVYESQLHSFIITMGGHLYKIPEAV